MSYVRFYSDKSFRININSAPTNIWNNIMESSTDGSTWSTWTGTPLYAVLDSSTNKYNIYLRGTGNTKVSNATSIISNPPSKFVFNSDENDVLIDCEGNLESLLDYATVDLGQHPTMDTYAFTYLFCNQSKLRIPPKLGSLTLSNYCYHSLFRNCTSLIWAPELPATTLGTYCYNCMFRGCTSLTIPPKLIATTLTSYCYPYMFLDSGIRLSTTQHDDYTLSYRIPDSGTGTTGISSLSNMFTDSSGSSYTPSINTTYYIKDAQYMVTESEITAIADAIRLSSNSNASLTYPDDFIDEIEDMGTAFCYSKDSVPDDNFGDNGDLCIISENQRGDN